GVMSVRRAGAKAWARERNRQGCPEGLELQATMIKVRTAKITGGGAAVSPSDRVWREHGLRTAVLAGDEQAWRTWYEESFNGLHAYVCWRCAGLRDLADELVQETWLTAVRRVRSFDPECASFAAWLRGIAANVLRNHLRARRRVRPTVPLNGALSAPVKDERADAE